VECVNGRGLDRGQSGGCVLSRLGTPIRALYARRELVAELTARELRDRHAGQVLGVVWAYGHPLLLMLLYTFLFAYVFPARAGLSSGAQDYSVSILAGIVSWLAFQDILARAPSILLTHANLVKQIVFPTEVLPLKTALASALPFTGGLLFAIAYAAWHDTLSWLTLALPVLVAMQLLAMIGVAFLLAAGGVFLRDLREFVTVFCSVNLFAQPILYSPFATPDWMQWLFAINPFSYQVWCWQDALFYGEIAHPAAWIIYPSGSVATAALGWIIFERTRHSFGDAL